jgi:large subunit ribosomal protein L13
MANPNKVERRWHLLDAQGQVLGRLAVRAAVLLRGKHKALYTPAVDCGDTVVVVNAEKIRVTGSKAKQKVYERYSGYPGGLKRETLEKLLVRRPTEVVRRAVVGMLAHNSLGRSQARRLRVYVGGTHPHQAQMSAKS